MQNDLHYVRRDGRERAPTRSALKRQNITAAPGCSRTHLDEPRLGQQPLATAFNPAQRFFTATLLRRAAPLPEVGAKGYARRRNNLPVAIRINKGERSWRGNGASSDQVRGKKQHRRGGRWWIELFQGLLCLEQESRAFPSGGRWLLRWGERWRKLRGGLLKRLAGQYGAPLKRRGGQANSACPLVDRWQLQCGYCRVFFMGTNPVLFLPDPSSDVCAFAFIQKETHIPEEHKRTVLLHYRYLWLPLVSPCSFP